MINDTNENNFQHENFDKLKLENIVDFGNKISKSIDKNFIFNSILLTCMGNLLISKGAIYYSEHSNPVLMTYKGFIKEELPDEIDIMFSDKIDEPITDEKIINKYFKVDNIGLIFPFKNSEQFKGFLILGNKINKSKFDNKEINLVKTIYNLSAPLLENISLIEKLKKVNSALNNKIIQMNSLVELSKEFNLILDELKISRIFSYTILGNLLVKKYVIFQKLNNVWSRIDGNISGENLEIVCKKIEDSKRKSCVESGDLDDKSREILKSNSIVLSIPMVIRNEIRGMVFLGSKGNQTEYSSGEIEFLETLSGISIASLENIRLFRESLEKQRLEEDLKLSRDIQRGLLPGKMPDSELIDIYAINLPSRHVSGDYYDVFRLSDHEIMVLIADVSGKGIGASLIMANLQALIKSMVRRKDFNFAEATSELNDVLVENLNSGKFVTFFWAIINEKEKTIQYVNAGHNPPFLISGDQIRKLEKGGMLLGAFNFNSKYEMAKINLTKNDIIVLYTDGVTEAKNINDEEFGEQTIERFFTDNRRKSVKELVNLLISEIQNFSKDTEQFDDITLVALKILN